MCSRVLWSCHKLWVVTNRINLHTQVAKLLFGITSCAYFSFKLNWLLLLNLLEDVDINFQHSLHLKWCSGGVCFLPVVMCPIILCIVCGTGLDAGGECPGGLDDRRITTRSDHTDGTV